MGGNVEQCKIVLPIFVSVRLDRSRHGGEILFWVKDYVDYKVLQSGPYNLELISISIDLPRHKNVCLGDFIFSQPPLLLCLIHCLMLFVKRIPIPVFTVRYCTNFCVDLAVLQVELTVLNVCSTLLRVDLHFCT